MAEIGVELRPAAFFATYVAGHKPHRGRPQGTANTDTSLARRAFHPFNYINVLGLLAAMVLAGTSPVAAFSGTWSSRLSHDAYSLDSSLLLRVNVICSKERIGTVIRTRFCEDGFICAAGGKCEPGAAMKQESEQRLKALKAELQRLDELDRQLKNAAAAARGLATPSQSPRQSAPCSDITGTGGGSGRSNCAQSNAIPRAQEGQMNRPRYNSQGQAAPQPVVVLYPPRCSMCDVLTTVGEVLPDLAEKLKNIKPEIVTDIEPPLADGGPNTLHPYLPRRPLPIVTASEDPLDAINDMKDLASDAKALIDLADKNKEAEDYAETCQDGFLNAAWKAFTAKDGSYGEKAREAKGSLKKCWKAAGKHIVDGVTKAFTDPNAESEEK